MYLKNTYYLMRHGQSHSNVKKIISSDIRNNAFENGLTKLGREQVVQAAKSFSSLVNNPIIYSSDFLRAKETAQIVAKQFNTDVIISDKLRERFFGNFDGTSISNYSEVWDRDKLEGPDSEFENCESINNIIRRINTLITKIERAKTNQSILLVSHGDPIVAFLGNFNNTGIIHHFDNAEIRKLN